MIRMQNQCDVERPFRRSGRMLSVQHQQEIRRMRKRPLGLNNLLSLANTVVGRHDHRDLRSQANGLIHIRFRSLLFSCGS